MAQPLHGTNLDPAHAPTQVERRYFVDRGVWLQEQQTVFRHSWQLVAHASELPEAGDYVTRRMGTDGVIVVRDEDGEIHVLVNACTHRGTLLCKADKGNTSHFRCGYHGWLFSNDGHLSGVPRRNLYGSSFQTEHLGLVSARVTDYYGLIFATFDPQLPEFTDYIAGLDFYLSALLNRSDRGTTAPFGSLAYRHAGNWKLEADNFIGDGYHLAHAHRAGFEMGIMGTQASATDGVCVQFRHGHALRAQRAAGSSAKRRFPGYPETRVAEIERRLGRDQSAFAADLSSTHGLVFPNTTWLHTSRDGGLDPGEPDVAMLQLRTIVPIGPRASEVRMWLITPADYPDEWKTAAYKSMHRQHGPAAFFESDDFENFKRIDEAESGYLGVNSATSNFELALDNHPYQPWFEGPGNIVGSDISEVNQRWFYGAYLDQLHGGA